MIVRTMGSNLIEKFIKKIEFGVANIVKPTSNKMITPMVP